MSAKTRLIKNNLFFIVVCVVTGLALLPLFAIIVELLVKGYKQINLSFFITHIFLSKRQRGEWYELQ